MESTIKKLILTLICSFLHSFDQRISHLHLFTSKNIAFGKCCLTFLTDNQPQPDHSQGQRLLTPGNSFHFGWSD